MYGLSRYVSNHCLLATVLLLSFVVPRGLAHGQDLPNADSTAKRQVLSLADAVVQALRNNLDITISRQSRNIRLTDILFEQAKFDPTLDISGRYDRSITPLNRPLFGFSQIGPNAEPTPLDEIRSEFEAGVSQKLITGGDYDLTFDLVRDSVAGNPNFLFNPVFQPTLALNLSQPLLRDFGTEINQTQIQIARNNARVEEHQFFNDVLDVIANVEQNYWELVFARENLKVAGIALEAAKELEASNRAKAKAGVMTIVDVLQAQAAVAARQGEVILAEKTIGDQEDQLRRLLNPGEQELRQQVHVIPIDKPVQTLDAISLQEAIDTAMMLRPEVLQAHRSIQTSKLNRVFAKNQLLPSLSVEGTGGVTGIGGTATGDSLERTLNGDFYNLGVGLVLSYPLGNRSAWSQYNKRKLEARNAEVSLQSSRQEVIITVKEAVRRVRTDFKRIETTRSARILAERQLKAEEERLKVGLSITRFVLDFQRDLAIAQSNELRAIVDYNKSRSNLHRQKATTLKQYGIEIL